MAALKKIGSDKQGVMTLYLNDNSLTSSNVAQLCVQLSQFANLKQVDISFNDFKPENVQQLTVRFPEINFINDKCFL